MPVEDLRSFDLNLLLTLEALLHEHNVTRAAARLGVTQSTVSHALGRLRAALGDPLLVRTQQGMLPTPFAVRLAEPLRRALEALGELVRRGPDFDPATARLRFRVAAADLASALVLPALMQRLASEAPGVDLQVSFPSSDMHGDLVSGAVDLALGLFREAPAGFRRQLLVRERFVCLARRGHPGLGEALDLATYLALPHVVVSPSGRAGSIVDDALAALGHARRVTLTVPHFLVAPMVVARTDALLTTASRLARQFVAMLPLQILAPPIDLAEFALSQLWHERVHEDPAHAWLRGALVAAVSAEPGPKDMS